MKVIIAGSRDIHDYALLERAIAASGFLITEVVSGTQRGVDQMGERWSREMLHKRPIRVAPKSHTDEAYRVRNFKMAAMADCLIAIPGPKRASGVDGTGNMIFHMRAHGKPVYIAEWEDNNVAV